MSILFAWGCQCSLHVFHGSRVTTRVSLWQYLMLLCMSPYYCHRYGMSLAAAVDPPPTWVMCDAGIHYFQKGTRVQPDDKDEYGQWNDRGQFTMCQVRQDRGLPLYWVRPARHVVPSRACTPRPGQCHPSRESPWQSFGRKSPLIPKIHR